MTIPRFVLLAILTAVVVPATAHAQAPVVGPVQCFVRATDVAFITRLQARRLCLGATSDMPARCADVATDQLALTDFQAARLCQGATSMEPASCAQRLDDTTAYTQNTIVEYCAALRYPLIPAQAGGSAACITAADDRTTLTDPESLRLCAGSRSAAPVDCYEWGDDNTTISNDDLIELCSPAELGYPRPYWVP